MYCLNHYNDLDQTKKSVSDGKILVANAITAKGVTTATDATFATMANNINSISTGVSYINIYVQITYATARSGNGWSWGQQAQNTITAYYTITPSGVTFRSGTTSTDWRSCMANPDAGTSCFAAAILSINIGLG